jgi:hypothetical protein
MATQDLLQALVTAQDPLLVLVAVQDLLQALVTQELLQVLPSVHHLFQVLQQCVLSSISLFTF